MRRSRVRVPRIPKRVSPRAEALALIRSYDPRIAFESISIPTLFLALSSIRLWLRLETLMQIIKQLVQHLASPVDSVETARPSVAVIDVSAMKLCNIVSTNSIKIR